MVVQSNDRARTMILFCLQGSWKRGEFERYFTPLFAYCLKKDCVRNITSIYIIFAKGDLNIRGKGHVDKLYLSYIKHVPRTSADFN